MKPLVGAGRTRRILFVALSILVTAHRLPAPIVESEEKPTPAAVLAPTAKPSHKPKPKSEASQSAVSPARQPASAKQSRFAGTWAGTMPEVPWGNVATELVVDQTETTMEWQNVGNSKRSSAKATLTGGTLSARFPAGFTSAVWYITPQPGGTMANVRLIAFMNDQTAVFHRVSESSAVKTAR